jgi:phosphatidylglycerophosphate synthase
MTTPAEVGKPTSDGLYCQAVQRRVSWPISQRLPARVSPNMVTAVDLVVGLLGAGLLAVGVDIPGVILVQVFGVLSCVDGEVARLRGAASPVGDFCDTMVDRVVELAVIIALTMRLQRVLTDSIAAQAIGMGLLGATFLLTLSSEKYRSAFKQAYPKRQLEGAFLWVSSGSDVRLLIMCLGVLLARLLDRPILLAAILGALAVVSSINLAYRLGLVISRESKGI